MFGGASARCAGRGRSAVLDPRSTAAARRDDARRRHRGEPVTGQPSMRWVVQNDVRSVVVAAWAAALNSAVVETPYQWDVA